MGEISLFCRAISDYKAAGILIQNLDADDNIVDIVGYHLQQAVEKLLKFQIEMQGEQYPFTHDITLLLDAIEHIPKWLDKYKETLMQYSTKTRYSSMRVASKKTIFLLYDEIGKYIETIRPTKQTDASAKPNL